MDPENGTRGGTTGDSTSQPPAQSAPLDLGSLTSSGSAGDEKFGVEEHALYDFRDYGLD
jgi:hypothetical protein